MSIGNSMMDFVEHSTIKCGSEKSFGITLSIVLVLIALWPVLNVHPPRYILLATSAVLLIVSIIAPRFLIWPNRLWFKLGLLLGHIFGRVTLGLVFFLCVMPIGVALKYLLKKKLLQTAPEPARVSYWIDRTEQETSMKNQF